MSGFPRSTTTSLPPFLVTRCISATATLRFMASRSEYPHITASNVPSGKGMCSNTPLAIGGAPSNLPAVLRSMGSSGSYSTMDMSPNMPVAVSDMFPNPEPASSTLSPGRTPPDMPLLRYSVSLPSDMYEFTLSYTGIMSRSTSITRPHPSSRPKTPQDPDCWEYVARSSSLILSNVLVLVVILAILMLVTSPSLSDFLFMARMVSRAASSRLHSGE